jgi:hypothetical protein
LRKQEAKTGNRIMGNLSWLSEVELISVHVPKTAGSTFGYKILPQVYKPEEILYDNDFLPISNLIETSKLKRTTKVIHGHFAATKYLEHCPNAKIVILLRHPILLLISAYYFWMSFSMDNITNENHRYVVEKKLSFEEFVEQDFTCNIVNNYFAKNMKLTDFYWVGIQEFFREDLNYIKNKLGWPPLKVNTSNRNSYENYPNKVREILTNQSLVKNIIAINSADMKLYQEALNLRHQRKGLSNYLEMYELSLKELQSRLRYNSCKELKLNKCSALGVKGVNPP